MNSKLLSSAIALAAALTSLPALAYNDDDTHPRITRIAVWKSALYADETLMFRLGLAPAPLQLFNYRYRPAKGEQVYPAAWVYDVADLIAEGNFDEDVIPRSLHHFFDPHFDSPLTVGIPWGWRSWQWVLEQPPAFPPTLTPQERSLPDGLAFLRKAFTYNEGSAEQSELERGNAMGSFFLCLGTVVHHLQDMAQPQHVRNDDHLDHPWVSWTSLYKPSRYEAYTRLRSDVVEAKALGAGAVYPGPGSGAFKTARDFWFNDAGSGIAQYTNKHFVSQGTNFTVSTSGEINQGTYPLPAYGAPADYTVQELFEGAGEIVPGPIAELCSDPDAPCTMTMYPAGPLTKASTLSIFDQDLAVHGPGASYPGQGAFPAYQAQRAFALNRFNFDDAHQVLIGEAASYTTGFINHLFRGKIEVGPPATGAYAAVDHSQGVGFTTLRATLKNATEGEALQGGVLRAIARFHRNGCYQPDLSGEFQEDENGQLQTPCPDFRSAEEYIRVTEPQPLGFAEGEERELTFTFADPIPLDATDLSLHVFYEREGSGPDPGFFALGAADISEPTFVAVMNATDAFELPTTGGGQFFYHKDITNPANIINPPYSIVDANGNKVYDSPPDVNVVGGNITYLISVDGRPTANVVALPEGRFARLALLVKPTVFQLGLKAFGSGFNSYDTYSMASKVNQRDPWSSLFVVSVVDELRSQTLQYASVTYYRYHPPHDDDLDSDDMPISKENDALIPVPAPVTGALVSAPSAKDLAPSAPGPGQATRRVSVEGRRRVLALDAADRPKN